MADAGATRRLTREELAESLLFYRRRLTQQIICAMIKAAAASTGGRLDHLYADQAKYAEDLANAICERLEARETGEPHGYRD